MKITIESTSKVVGLAQSWRDEAIDARIWEGFTESGIPVHCYIVRIAAPDSDGVNLEQFERELKEQKTPSDAVRSIPMRLIL